MEAIAHPPHTRRLILAQTTSAIGDGCFYVTSALFLSHVVGLSATMTGLWLSIAWGAGFLLSAPVGSAADRAGLKLSGVTLSLVVAGTLVAATQVRDHGAFLLVLIGYAVAQSGLGAVRQAWVAELVPPADRVTVRARLHVAINAGIGLGAALAGIALAVGTTRAYTTVLWLDAAGFVVAAWLLAGMPGNGLPRRPRTTTGNGSPRLPRRVWGGVLEGLRGGVLGDRPYLSAAALAAVLYLYMPLLSVVLPLFLVQRTVAPAWSVALVFVINTIGVLALQVRAARPVQDTRTAARASRRGGLVMGASCLVLAAAALPGSAPAALALVALGAVVQVVGEVLLGAGAWHIGFALADPQRQGQWQGLFASGLPLARSVGPLLLSALVLTWSGPGWVVLAAVFGAAGLALGPVAAWGERSRPATHLPEHTPHSTTKPTESTAV